MKKYNLKKLGNLLITRCVILGEDGMRVLNLLVDTGSTYTVVPMEVLESIGCNPSLSYERVRIITGSGYILAPKVKVKWFNCLGAKIENFEVVAHTLPPESMVDGLLGMDFLVSVKAKIDVFEGVIEI